MLVETEVNSPIVLQERARGVPSDTPNERVDQNSPDLHSNTRGSESQNARDEGQRTVAKGECPGNVLAFIDIHQSRRGTGRTRLVGAPAFCLMSHMGPRTHFLL